MAVDRTRIRYWLLGIGGGLVVALLLGVVLPIVYYRYVPVSAFVEVKGFAAECVEKGQQVQVLLLDRYSTGDFVGEMFLDLVLRDGAEKEVHTWRQPVFLESGEREIEITIDLPRDLVCGSYRYDGLLVFKVGPGVARKLSFSSNVFTILR